MKPLNLTIRGAKWQVYHLPEDVFDAQIGTRYEAITYPDKRAIVFRIMRFNEGVVRHEVFHGYFAESLLQSCNLNSHQTEEAACEVYANHGRQMDKDAKVILKWLRKQK